jgi:hypothetical protein
MLSNVKYIYGFAPVVKVKANHVTQYKVWYFLELSLFSEELYTWELQNSWSSANVI